MLAPYRLEHLSQVRAFARQQPEFDYLLAIIRAHTEERFPGGVYVWLADGSSTHPHSSLAPRPSPPVLAICAIAYPNRHDAWLYGMRVDDRAKGAGIATRMTRELMHIARKSGHTWIALDTLDHPKKAPVFRITEKLGMKYVTTHATAVFWNLPRRFSCPDPRHLRPNACSLPLADHWRTLGVRLLLHEYFPRWIWTRLESEGRTGLSRNALLVGGVPVHLVSDSSAARRSSLDSRSPIPARRHPSPVLRSLVNLFDRPPDFRSFLSALLPLAVGNYRHLVLNFPAEWQRDLDRDARALVLELRKRRNYDLAAWRIYARGL